MKRNRVDVGLSKRIKKIKIDDNVEALDELPRLLKNVDELNVKINRIELLLKKLILVRSPPKENYFS